MAIVSCDEKLGIQAIATTAPDLPPEPGVHASVARDHKRHGTLNLFAGIDLLTGKVDALVRDRHRSHEFIEFFRLLDAAYPRGATIKLILDNHSAHTPKETRAWLASRPTERVAFALTPRSALRHIRVISKHEFRERIMAGIDDVNRRPVIHTCPTNSSRWPDINGSFPVAPAN